ncbi:MAG: hypothetical protein ABW168_23975 [Sedimenticola sp.]
MLTIKNNQVDCVESKRFEANLETVRQALKQEYASYIEVEVCDDTAEYFTWFDAQVKQCKAYNITTSSNIKSYCLYVIHHYPEFPTAEKFKSCRAIMNDLELDDGDKMDKVNYRLLYLR